jgi:predicted O-linked N-acetylglucosamine transferase (SPINDLY family)
LKRGAAAPLQVGYIGYLGTMSAPFIDYLVADRTIIPTTHRPHYAERISRHLEAAYLAIYERYIADLPPDDLEIPRGDHPRT